MGGGGLRTGVFYLGEREDEKIVGDDDNSCKLTRILEVTLRSAEGENIG